MTKRDLASGASRKSYGRAKGCFMNNRQRTINALNHKQPDKVPYNITFTKAAHGKMVEFYKDPDFESKLENCLPMFLPVAGGIQYWQISNYIWVDEFGVKWDRKIDKDIGNVCNRLVTPDNVNDFQLPDPDNPARYDFIDEFIAANKDNSLIMAAIGFSLFERAWTLAGMENVLMAMVSDKTFINNLLDRILEFNLQIIEKTCTFDIDVFYIGDDWGHQHGLIMGPTLWREFIKPRIKQMYQLIKSKGKFVLIHSCGKIEEILPDLIECGLDVFNPFQPEVMDIFDVKKKYGRQLTFYGGISIQETLPFSTVSEVKDQVKHLLDVIGENGGYIASPSHDIPADAKPENIAAMIEVLQNQ